MSKTYHIKIILDIKGYLGIFDLFYFTRVVEKLMLYQLKTVLLSCLSLELFGLVLLGSSSSISATSDLVGAVSSLHQPSLLTAVAQPVSAETFPSYVELNVPYFSQYDNENNPDGTSNVTALAMVLAYYGIQPKTHQGLPDELNAWMLNQGLNIAEPLDQVKLSKHYGLQDNFKTNATWSEVLEALKNGQPVVVHGYFVKAIGHIITLVGYTPSHMIVNDPYGDAMTGYANKDGKQVLYPIDYMLQVLTPEGPGNIWAHFITP
jgi:uncharacterized protein YvpB